jgi:hypothetical protein
VQHSYSSDACDANAPATPAPCEAGVSATLELRKLTGSHSTSASSNNATYPATATGSLDADYEDAVTPTSSTIAEGTQVQFESTLDVTGTVDENCDDADAGNSLAAGAFGVGVSGSCSNGTFMFAGYNSGAGQETDAAAITLTMGQPFMVQNTLSLNSFVGRCSTSQQNGCDFLGAQSNQFTNIEAVWHLKPITPHVSYTTASGTKYP